MIAARSPHLNWPSQRQIYVSYPNYFINYQHFQSSQKLIKVFMQPDATKTSLCRFYLRGNCPSSQAQCKYAHGIENLNFVHWKLGDVVETDYLAETFFNQDPKAKCEKNYINLYEYQLKEGYPHYHRYSLKELNEDREKRKIVRKILHQNQFEEFLNLLLKKYPDSSFTEEFLNREYLRAGFNKLMTSIHFSFFTNYLLANNYFKISLTVPPHVKAKRVYYFNQTSNEEIFQFYKGKVMEYCENKENTIEEGEVKKYLMGVERNFKRIPPINEYLRQERNSFSNFIQKCLGNALKTQSDTIFEIISKFAESHIKEHGYILMKDIQEYLESLNKAKHTNMIYPWIQKTEKIIFKMQNYNIITSPQNIQNFEFQPLKCSCEHESQLSEWNQKIMEVKEVEGGEMKTNVIMIDSEESYEQNIVEIKESKQLGVDLEGDLSKEGEITMIQLNNGEKIYLIDYLTISNSSENLKLNIKEMLKYLMTNPKIIKVFHYCRQDSIALHYLTGTCINNIFDTSAVDSFINQLTLYKENKFTFEKNVILTKFNNLKTPGLNQILKKYKAPNGMNKFKDKFHKMFGSGDHNITDKRPLDPEFKEYCVMDVMDLLYLKEEMGKGLNPYFVKWLGSLYRNESPPSALKEIQNK